MGPIGYGLGLDTEVFVGPFIEFFPVYYYGRFEQVACFAWLLFVNE